MIGEVVQFDHVRVATTGTGRECQGTRDIHAARIDNHRLSNRYRISNGQVRSMQSESIDLRAKSRVEKMIDHQDMKLDLIASLRILPGRAPGIKLAIKTLNSRRDEVRDHHFRLMRGEIKN